jgi:hypothetical protein
MPGHNGFRFDDNRHQDVSPCWPKTTEKNPEYPILDSEPRARMFSLEYTQLLTEGKDLQAKAVTGTEEGVEEAEKADEKRNHGPALIAQAYVPASALTA